MAKLTESIQNALDYMEANLTGELELREIAKRAYLSPYYFQRVFAPVDIRRNQKGIWFFFRLSMELDETSDYL